MDPEEREKKLKSFKPLLRSVVQSNPRGVAIHDLCREFRNITYEDMPFRKLGLRSAEDLLRLCKDTVMVVHDPMTGGSVVRAVADQSTAHLQELISRQKKPKARKGKGPPRQPYRPSGGPSYRPSFNPGRAAPPRFGQRSYPAPPMPSSSRPAYPPSASQNRSGGFAGRLGFPVSRPTSSYGGAAAASPASSIAPASVSSAASSGPSYGNPVTLSSPDNATLEAQFIALISTSQHGLFLPRLLVLFGQKHRRDLTKDVALKRMSQMGGITIDAIQSNHILYVKKGQSVSTGPSPAAAPRSSSANAALPSSSSSSNSSSPGPASASTRPASATTAGMATTNGKARASPAPVDDLISHPVADRNYKNMLMTYVVKRFGSAQQNAPIYEHTANHDGSFTATVTVAGSRYQGTGAGIKTAHFVAAKEALTVLQRGAPRSAAAARSIPASEIGPMSIIANELSRSVHVASNGSEADDADAGGRSSSPGLNGKQVATMRPLKPLTASAPHPPSYSVWKDVQQKKGYLDVHITSVQGPYCVYATLYENRGVCQELDMLLQPYHMECEPDLAPLRSKKEKSVCLVFGDEGAAYRAVIEYLDMKNSQVVVRYLDHGDTDTVPFGELFELPADLYWPEYQAFKMVLQNLTAVGDDIQKLTDELKELILEKDMVADVLYQIDPYDERLWVDLWDTSSGSEDVNINEELRKHYKTTQEFSLDLPDAGEELMVRVTQVTVGAYNTSVFVQRAQNSSFINKMVQRMTRHFEDNEDANRAQSLLREDELAEGARCCVRFADDKWYRCVIRSVLPGRDSCEVYFLDYGYTSMVRRIQLRRMYSSGADSSDIVQLPPQCKECHLAGLRSSFDLTRKIEEYLNAVTEQVLNLTVVEKGATSASPDLVKVTFSERGQDIDLAERVQDIRDGRFTQKEMSAYIVAVSGRSSPLPSYGSEEPSSPSGNGGSTTGPLPVQRITPPLELPVAVDTTSREYFPILVMRGTSPSGFVAALATKEMVTEYDALTAVLESDASIRAKPSQPIRWSVGDVCVAPFESGFARARIVRLLAPNATVFLLDEGSDVEVAVSALRELPDTAWKCPFQAFFAKVYGVRPAAGDTWSKACLASFSACTTGFMMQGRFMLETLPAAASGLASRSAPVASLYLVDVSGANDLVISNELIRKGYGKPA